MKHENPDLPHQYVDVFKAAGAPEHLRSKVILERVWPRETIERHTEALRIFENRHDIYSRFDKMPREELNRRTLKRLQTLVGYAFENIPFYNRLYSGVGFQPGDLQSLEDFSRLPIVQKSDLRSLYEEVATQPFTQVNFKARTSGSTGKPLSIINDSNRQMHWFVVQMNMFEHMAGRLMTSSNWIYSNYYEPFLLSSILGGYKTFTVGLSADSQAPSDHIRQIRPAIVTGVASNILRVAKLLPDAKRLGIQAFTTNSESSSIGERKTLTDQLGVPILDEYSSEELGIIAWEERSGSYLVAEDTVHLELVENQEGMASVIGTDLWNFVMPRIRYDHGDYAQWEVSEPSLGLRRIKSVLGRQDMKLISYHLGPIDAGRILEIFDVTLVPESAGIEEFRLVQKSMFDFRLLLKSSLTTLPEHSLAIQTFQGHFRELFGELPRLRVEYVDHMPTLGVKRRCIVREFRA